MKKFLALVLALVLVCGMLASCQSVDSILEQAEAALLTTPYTMTMKMAFSSDNKTVDQILSIMNVEIPVTVDGKNIAMDMELDIMGATAGVEAIVADMVMYYNIQVMS